MTSILAHDAAISLGFECAILLALTLLLIALIGVPRRSAPRCRKCGADARPPLAQMRAAMRVRDGSDHGATCACGRSLTRIGGVRWRGSRRLWLLGIIAVLLLIAAASVLTWSVRLDRAGLHHWRDVLPAERLVRQFEANPNGGAPEIDVLRDLTRRVAAGRLSEAHLRRVLEAGEWNELTRWNLVPDSDFLGLALQFASPDLRPSIATVLWRRTPVVDPRSDRVVIHGAWRDVAFPLRDNPHLRRHVRESMAIIAVRANGETIWRAGDDAPTPRDSTVAATDVRGELTFRQPPLRLPVSAIDGSELEVDLLVIAAEASLDTVIRSVRWSVSDIDAVTHEFGAYCITATAAASGGWAASTPTGNFPYDERVYGPRPRAIPLILEHPIAGHALGTCGGLLLAVLLLRMIAARRRASAPRCRSCGHAVAALDQPRCAECGADFRSPTAQPSGRVRWDAPLPSMRMASTALAQLALIVVVVGSVAYAGAWVASALRLSDRAEANRLAREGFGPDEHRAWNAMFSLLIHMNRTRVSEAARTVLRNMPASGLSERSREGGMVHAVMIERLVERELEARTSPDVAVQLSPETRAVIDGFLASARPRVKIRHRIGNMVSVETSTIPEPSDSLRLLRNVHSIRLNDSPMQDVRGAAGSITEFSPWRSKAEWLSFPDPGTSPNGSRTWTLRIDWSLRLVEWSEGAVASDDAVPLWERRLVHELPIEFVQPEEPARVATTDREFSPWGERLDAWTLHARTIGSRQFVRLHAFVPTRGRALVAGQWSVEQDGAVVPLGGKIATAGPSLAGEDPPTEVPPTGLPTPSFSPTGFPPTGVQRTALTRLEDHFEWEVGGLLESPLDLRRPFTIRFDPDPLYLMNDWSSDVEYDYIWAEPLVIVVPPRGAKRRTIAPGWFVWERFGTMAKHDPAARP